MKPTLTCLVLICLLVTGLREASATDLVIGVVNNPPTTGSGHQPGFLKDILREACNRLGLSVSFVVLPPERSLRMVNGGQIDGDISRIKGLEKTYPNFVPIEEPIWLMRFTGFVRESYEEVSLVTPFQDLHIGYIRGWKIYERAFEKNALATSTKDALSLFKMLESRRIDLAMYSYEHGLYIASHYGIKAEPEKTIYAAKDAYTYLHKKHAGLAVELARVYREMKADGSYQAIIDRVMEQYTRRAELID